MDRRELPDSPARDDARAGFMTDRREPPRAGFQGERAPLVPSEFDIQQGYELPCEQVTVDGGEVRLFTVPEGITDVNRTVVCLPGLGASGRSFAPLRTLSSRYRFLFWTPPLETPKGLPPLHFNVRALNDAPAIPQKFALVGSSYGSLVALDFALQRQERVKALVLVSPVASTKKIRNGALLAHTAMKVPLPFGYVFAPTVARVLGGGELQPTARAEFVREARRISPGEMSRRLKDILATNLMPELPSLRVPTLVIHGDRDHIVPMSSAMDVARDIPDSHFVVIKGAAHLPYMSHPDEFNAALDDFLSKVSRE